MQPLEVNIKTDEIIMNKTNLLSSEISTNQFCWRPSWVYPYKSLWSLLQKFAYLNYTNVGNLKKTFKLDSDSKGTNWKWQGRDDLRFIHGLNPDVLSRILGIDKTQLKETVINGYLRDEEVDMFSCSSLRFCPSCIKDGYHSPIYQLLFVERCPLHRKVLIDMCEFCKKTIPYRLIDLVFKKPMCCPFCSTILTPRILQFRARSVASDNRWERLDLYIEWLRKRRNLNTTIFYGASFRGNNNTSQKIKIFIKNFEHYWSDLINPEPTCLIKKRKIKQISIQLRNIHSDGNFQTTTNSIKENTDEDLYAIYKSIARYILKKKLRSHRNCVVNVGRGELWFEHALTCSGKICPYANAFILWRMFIESLNHPSKLFCKFKRKSYKQQWVFWQPPLGLNSSSLIRRVFAVECYWIFLECINLAKKFLTDNCYSFNIVWVTGETVPVCIIDYRLEKNFIRVNYWIENADDNRKRKNKIVKCENIISKGSPDF
jgi:hypothetical protein